MGNLARFFAGTISHSDLVNPALWLQEIGGGTTASGEPVTSSTALGLSAYYACLRNVSEDVAKMPRQLRKRRSNRGSDPVSDHPVYRLWARRPNPLMSGYTFLRTIVHRAMAWGIGCAEIERDEARRPIGLWPIAPERITPKTADDGKSIVYEWRATPTSTPKMLAANDVFAVSGLGDGLVGYSVLRYASETFGLGLAAQKHAAAFFGEGMTRRMVALVKGVMQPEAREGLRKRIAGDSLAQPVGTRKIPILEGDVTMADMGIPPDEAQFLEQREFTVEEVARWFRVALPKLQYHKRAQGWASLEALNTDYVTDALLPWAVCIEEECWAKLLDESEQDDHYFKVQFQGLMRGDYAARTSGYSTLRNVGVLSANDIRELEDMNPIEGEDGDGDLYLVQGALKPMRDEEPVEEPPVTETFGGALQVEAPVEEPEPEPEEDDEAEEEPDVEAMAEACRPVFLAAARLVVDRERRAIEGALRRNADNSARLAEWSAAYYAEHGQKVREVFAPALETLARLTRRPIVVAAVPADPPADLAAYVATDPEVIAEALAGAVLGDCVAGMEATRG